MQPLLQHPHASWRWMLPLVMLILAALACDETYIEPPKVTQVQADPALPGRAYALVYISGAAQIVYETDDYGQHWARSQAAFPNYTPADAAYTMEMRGESLYFRDRALWSFPRPIFRFFFFDGLSSFSQDFRLPYGQVSNALQGDTLYVPMGTEGILVARMTGIPSLLDARLTNNGLDTLNPLPLTITNSTTLIRIVLAALLVPPYALIHAYLLTRVWGYVLPRSQARSSSLYTAFGLSLVAAVGVVIWLTDIHTDYYQIVAAVTFIVVLISLIQTARFAREAELSSYARNRIFIGAILVSLIVPLGIAGIFTSWWLVYTLVFGYFAYQRVYIRHLSLPVKSGDENRRQRWFIDRLSLETFLLSIVVPIIMIFGVYFATIFVGLPSFLRPWLPLLIPIVGIGASWLTTRWYLNHRLRNVVKGKRFEQETQPLLPRLQHNIHIATFGSALVVIVASVITFIAQLIAYRWFTALLVN